MTQRMRELADEIVRLQAELDREIESKRKALGWTVEDGLVTFAAETRARHRRLRTPAWKYVWQRSAGELLTAPLIYSMIVPLLLLDGWTALYQAVCFRAYGIPPVRREDHIALDAQHLGYLNWIEKLDCYYCAYANGVLSWIREIAARTEQYWCPIKHALRISDPHHRYWSFLEYGDAEGYRDRLADFRERLRAGRPNGADL